MRSTFISWIHELMGNLQMGFVERELHYCLFDFSRYDSSRYKRASLRLPPPLIEWHVRFRVRTDRLRYARIIQ